MWNGWPREAIQCLPMEFDVFLGYEVGCRLIGPGGRPDRDSTLLLDVAAALNYARPHAIAELGNVHANRAHITR
jgi:hypothetical protein